MIETIIWFALGFLIGAYIFNAKFRLWTNNTIKKAINFLRSKKSKK